MVIFSFSAGFSVVTILAASVLNDLTDIGAAVRTLFFIPRHGELARRAAQDFHAASLAVRESRRSDFFIAEGTGMDFILGVIFKRHFNFLPLSVYSDSP
jgi:hypothetical protein